MATLSVDKKALVIPQGEHKFALTRDGLKQVVAAGETPMALTADMEKHIMGQALLEIEPNGAKLAPEVKAILPDVVANLKGKGLDADRLKTVTARAEALAELRGLKKGEESVKRATELLKDPEVKALLADADKSHITKIGGNLGDIEKELADLATRKGRIDTATKEIEGLLSAKKIGGPALEKAIGRNIDIIDEIKPSTEALEKAAATSEGKYAFSSAVTSLKAEFKTEATQLETLSKKWAEQHRIIATKPKKEVLEAAEAESKKVLEEINKIKGGKFGSAHEIEKGLAAELKMLNAPFLGSFTGNAAGAGKEGGGFLRGLLMKNEEALAKTATKQSKAVSELGFLSRVHPGKAAGWIAGIGAVYVATVGRNRDKGKYTDAVVAQQPTQGVGIGA